MLEYKLTADPSSDNFHEEKRAINRAVKADECYSMLWHMVFGDTLSLSDKQQKTLETHLWDAGINLEGDWR